jgi:hypothetical protein
MIPLVYVAGPYRSPTAWGIEQNIVRARAWGAELAKAGAYPVIPHSNTSHFDGLAADDFWLAGTLELLRRCDGAVFIPGWTASSGSKAEHAAAHELGIDVLEVTITSVLEPWVARLRARKS